MATKKKVISKPPPWYSKIVAKINFNTILMTIVTGYFGIMGMKYTEKQDVVIQQSEKQDSINTRQSQWRKRSDSLHTIVIHKLDSIISQTKN